MNHGLYLLLSALLAVGCAGAPPDEVADSRPGDEVPYAPSITPRNLGIAGYAKVLCSAVFVSGRKIDDARNVSGYFLVPEKDFKDITDISVDHDRKAVRVTLRDLLTREARYFGDQGCVIIPEGEDGVFFQPTAVTTTLPDPSTQDWPMGDRLKSSSPEGVDEEKLDAAVALAFKDPKSLTAAFVVLYKGQIVAERYGEDAHRDMQLESWSMGKSITATLIGLLIR